MSYLKEANRAFKAECYKEAIDYYKKALEMCPSLENFISFNIGLAESKVESIQSEKISDNHTSSNDNGKMSHELRNKAILKFDHTNNYLAQGWVMDLDDKNNSVVLKVSVDGANFSLIESSMLRSDVKKVHGGDGFYGYRAELSPYTSFSATSTITIEPVSHVLDSNSNNTTGRPFPAILSGVSFSSANEKAKNISEKHLYKPTFKQQKTNVSVVILNLNGEKVLGDCVSSILEHNNSCEIIVVDHNSTDSSLQLLDEFNSERIKVIKRDGNYSYSDSNNLGAMYASGETIIFLNNDIVLTSDSISKLANIVNQSDFGLMGIKLWDLPRGDNFKIDCSLKVNQHLGVHFKGLSRQELLEAFELRNSPFISLEEGILHTPAVTAAMLCIRKSEFEAIGGFNRKYFYGQEDVDFCLRYGRQIKRKIGVALDEGAYHIRGLSRRELSQENKVYIGKNRKIIQTELGQWFRKEFRKGLFANPGFWNQKPLSVAMIVSEVGFETDKADFFTAKELGDAFEEKDDVFVGYFDSTTGYDVNGYDVVIVFIDGFDPRRLKNLSPHTILIGWARNWFDRWCERVWIEFYDILYASSEKARGYMEDTLKRKVGLLRIAASNDCIRYENNSKRDFKSDYVFTGSYFNSPREIADLLEPEAISHEFRLFGHNWENHSKFKKFTSGPVSYKEIPGVYANTKLVVDDANVATKKWGALNCRVFDCLAMGIPCITNNLVGVEEIFDQDFPVYSDKAVNDRIQDLLDDNEKRNTLAAKYRDIILNEHTYSNRRDVILSDVLDMCNKKFISIKIAAPDFERAVTWGDYHFARAVRNEFEKRGYKVRIDCIDQWHGERSLNDDVNIVLRGLTRFIGREDQTNFLWIISHPDLLCEEEIKQFQYTFVASDVFADKLSKFTGLENILSLHQASAYSQEKLDPAVIANTPSHEILFVGNSRNQYREVVRWCVEENLPISVYGGGWEQFIPKHYIKGQFIDNNILPYYYHNAGVVLNDHWEDMKQKGFVSNRVYDVLAVGGRILSDSVNCNTLANFPNYKTFDSKDSFIALLKEFEDVSCRECDLSKDILSFKERVMKISSVLERF